MYLQGSYISILGATAPPGESTLIIIPSTSGLFFNFFKVSKADLLSKICPLISITAIEGSVRPAEVSIPERTNIALANTINITTAIITFIHFFITYP